MIFSKALHRFCGYLIFLIILLAPFSLFAKQDQLIPEIKKISINDLYFKQLYFDIQKSYQAKPQGKKLPAFHLYRYRVKPTDDFYKLSAAFSIPIHTLSTLNQIDTPSKLKAGDEILLCNRQGLFIADFNTGHFLSAFIRHSRAEELEEALSLTIRGKPWFFLEGAFFNPREYAFFLKILYHYPLEEGILTSSFGMRKDPFRNTPSFHPGIDIAAPLGANVFASNDGVVIETGYNTLYGNYVHMKHSNQYETLYGHLKEIKVKKGVQIPAGTVIGLVGSTGKSTGPHLHFEIRLNGKPLDPHHFLQKNQNKSKSS